MKNLEKTRGYHPRVVVQFNDYVEIPHIDGVEKHIKESFYTCEKIDLSTLSFKRVFNALETEKIKGLIKRAEAMDEKYKGGNIFSFFSVDCPPGVDPEKLASYLNELSIVKKAYFDPPGSEPIVSPNTNPRFSNQGYLDPAPDGIDVEGVWPQAGGIGITGADGEGISVIDLERGWTFDHEDLIGQGMSLLHGNIRDGSRAHGTSVMGQICAVDNGLGCIGITSAVASANAVSYWGSSRPNAILAAIDNLEFGDVLLLEAQLSISGWSMMPIEVLDAEYEAIRLASALGIIVVEAAGNGGNDLDTYTDAGGNAIFNRTAAGFRDSGAIMVGAASSTSPHVRLGFSNFGSRIDCYAWGQNVNTTSSNSSGSTNLYTSTFNGTSSASPIITGAAISVQGMAEQNMGYRFSPGQMRAILSNPATGTNSNNPGVDRIGVMPDLQAIVDTDVFNIVPDIYMRDNIADIGDPHTGSISASPDIIVRPDPVANPAAAFGVGSGTENDTSLGREVEAGQDNYVYVRLKNRGGVEATNVNVTIYWSPASTLVTPNLWTEIGTINVPSVPAGNILTVSDPLIWSAADIPATGHYCFVGVVNHAQDPAPLLANLNQWDNFRAFIRNNNNVTWRNFNVVDLNPADPFVALSFIVPGAFDKARKFLVEIDGKLPIGSRVMLEVPKSWARTPNMMRRDVELTKGIKKLNRHVLIPLNPFGVNRLPNLRIPAKTQTKVKMYVHIPKKYRQNHYEIFARQLEDKLELGRVTWRIGPKTEPKKPCK